jgi:radical SAM superfamily enzyme YgiQ (UPF0313 family)
MYKDKKYRVRTQDEILEDIRMAREQYGDLEKVFLCDGDAIAMDTGVLLEIIGTLYRTFPSLRHVGSYVGPQSTLAKSGEELRALRAAGLTKAYIGVETGDDELLDKIKKGVNSEEMLRAGRNLVQADINLSVMVLLGLAGRGEASFRHAQATAMICNEMKPQYLATLTVTPVPGTILYQQIQKGEFELLEPMETLQEMKLMLENITVDNLKFVGTHASNYLPITGTLPKDKQKMIAAIDAVLKNHDCRLIRPERMRGL